MSEPPGTKEAPPRGSYANAVTRNYFENLLEPSAANGSGQNSFSPLPASMRNKTSVHFLFTSSFPTQQEFDLAISKHGAVNGSNEISNPSNNRTKIHEVFFQRDPDAATAVSTGIEFPRLGRVCALMPRPYAVNTKQHEIKINIKKIPTGLSRDELTQHLIDTLSMYGAVKVLGRYLSAEAKVFHGEAMAILVKDGNREYSNLHRVIQFKGDEELTMHLSWYNAPAFCHFCETEGHHRGECPRLKRSLWCTACRKHGHSATNCRTTLTDANDLNPADVEAAFNNNNNNPTTQQQQQQQQQQQPYTPAESPAGSSNNNNNNNNNNGAGQTGSKNDKTNSETETPKSDSPETEEVDGNEEEDSDDEEDGDYEPSKEEEEDDDDEEEEAFSEHEDDFNLDNEDIDMNQAEVAEAKAAEMDLDKEDTAPPKETTKAKTQAGRKGKATTKGGSRKSGRTASKTEYMQEDQ
ncbi:hypothetical protein BGX23_004596 [Mortierella sp. AD031]|nr:hypothetical protein BGX23_004596 [Mortierella sp. AD031]